MQFIFAAKILKLFISVIALGDEVKERQRLILFIKHKYIILSSKYFYHKGIAKSI